MLRWNEMPWASFRTGFRNGQRSGGISWPQAFLQLINLWLLAQSLNVLRTAWDHTLTPHLAVLQIKGLTIGLLLLASLLVFHLLRPEGDRRKAVVPAAMGCVFGATAVCLCLQHLG